MSKDIVTKCECWETEYGWSCRLWHNDSNDYAVHMFWAEPHKLTDAEAIVELVEFVVVRGYLLGCVPRIVD